VLASGASAASAAEAPEANTGEQLAPMVGGRPSPWLDWAR